MRIDPRFEQLYLTEYRTILRTVLALCGDQQVAADAVQEAFVRCLERWRRLGGQPWVAGWVTTTAINHARRLLQRSAVRSKFAARGHVNVAIPTDEAATADVAVDLWRGIKALPGREQEALILHYVMDLPVDQAAAAMRCAEGTDKSHLARGRRALRVLLTPNEDVPTRSEARTDD